MGGSENRSDVGLKWREPSNTIFGGAIIALSPPLLLHPPPFLLHELPLENNSSKNGDGDPKRLRAQRKTLKEVISFSTLFHLPLYIYKLYILHVYAKQGEWNALTRRWTSSRNENKLYSIHAIHSRWVDIEFKLDSLRNCNTLETMDSFSLYKN